MPQPVPLLRAPEATRPKKLATNAEQMASTTEKQARRVDG
jgi:hypothetical protein